MSNKILSLSLSISLSLMLNKSLCQTFCRRLSFCLPRRRGRIAPASTRPIVHFDAVAGAI